MAELNILVVDDSLTMRKIVVNTLRKLGYTQTMEAPDGKEALGKLYAEKVDLLITDWNMPEMNGMELIQAVRGDPSFKGLPILMLTTRGMKDDIVAALKAGANNYIVKPFDPDVLQKKMNEILGG